jgi:hypothetical protein
LHCAHRAFISLPRSAAAIEVFSWWVSIATGLQRPGTVGIQLRKHNNRLLPLSLQQYLSCKLFLLERRIIRREFIVETKISALVWGMSSIELIVGSLQKTMNESLQACAVDLSSREATIETYTSIYQKYTLLLTQRCEYSFSRRSLPDAQ